MTKQKSPMPGSKITLRSVCLQCRDPEWERGSITVEAALVLPLFLTAVILIACIMNLQYVHRQVGAALENTCRELSAYAYPAKQAASSLLPEGSGQILSNLYVQAAVTEKLQGDPVVGHLMDGMVDCSASEILEDGQIIRLVASYRMSMSLGIFRSGTLRFTQCVRMHAWTGYQTDTLSGSEETETLVYVAETGTVYHKDADCVYLNPTIRVVSADSVSTLRSKDGSIYHACELCGGSSETYYITSYGDRYHTDRQCSGLKRTVRQVPLSQVESSMGPCSKCGQ